MSVACAIILSACLKSRFRSTEGIRRHQKSHSQQNKKSHIAKRKIIHNKTKTFSQQNEKSHIAKRK